MAQLAISPASFCELHPEVSRERMATIAGCSLTTVNNWFAIADCQRNPTDHHKFRLGIYHWLASAPPEMREIMRQVTAP